ncbi:MAG: DsbC family protein [Desulfuromonadaceae bacterium]|nr:DsbC family protein [Desulfuromonadaceae bacterium]
MHIRSGFVAGLVSLAMLVCLVGGASAVTPEAALRAGFPQVKSIDSMTPSDIPGVWEVVSGSNVIFYYYPAKDLIIIGDILGKDLKPKSEERKAILAAKAAEAMEKVARELPLDKALKIGEGKHVVIEFTDPDCPFCWKLAEYFTKRPDVTQYVFFSPIKAPGSITKIQFILGAKDKVRAYDSIMLAHEIPETSEPATEATQSLSLEHVALSEKVGIRITPTIFIDGRLVTGTDPRKLDELLR